MPYITQEKRSALKQAIDALHMELVRLQLDDPENNHEGNMNYVISTLIEKSYCHPVNYANINDAMGILDSASKEFYRRVAAPYEDSKIEVNGDVYPKPGEL